MLFLLDYGPSPEICQYLNTPAINNSRCSEFRLGEFIPDSVICGGDENK